MDHKFYRLRLDRSSFFLKRKVDFFSFNFENVEDLKRLKRAMSADDGRAVLSPEEVNPAVLLHLF